MSTIVGVQKLCDVAQHNIHSLTLAQTHILLLLCTTGIHTHSDRKVTSRVRLISLKIYSTKAMNEWEVQETQTYLTAVKTINYFKHSLDIFISCLRRAVELQIFIESMLM